MVRPRGIVFDLDGTLVDSLPLVFDAFAEVLEPFVGERLPPEKISPMFGPPEAQILAQLIPAEHLAPATERLYRYYIDHPERVVVFPEVSELIRELRARGLHTGLFTGKGRRGTLITLNQVGLADCVDSCVTGDDTIHPKPHPEGLVSLIQQWRVRAEQVWMVGDTPSDILAGRGAGAVTVGALWGAQPSRRQELLDSKPDFVFEKASEFAEFCRRTLQ